MPLFCLVTLLFAQTSMKAEYGQLLNCIWRDKAAEQTQHARLSGFSQFKTVHSIYG
jgi:hypothetical protein